ncbi:PREDICTED: uncharacterized protein LOC109352923 [Lupinus angustifolius]|uniref:uncharacterized protein LOC109352923 n=1 Tax=Lupinus angustifolius TaxID=3871 RepID=UPI00092E4A3D|nr:PREDICTED: uncharacterized protein LOC109352923 [Lupinus angustifolius]
MNLHHSFVPWGFLANIGSSTHCPATSSPNAAPMKEKKSFAQALKNSCDISLSQLPQPCIKGDAIAIKIPKDEYQAGLARCQSHLHGRVILSKGDSPIKFLDLKTKLTSMWSMIGKWDMISLGRGFYDFSFSSIEDMRSVCAVGSWSLKPGVLRLSLWTPDFNPNLQKLSHSQCWVRILGLPQEYWSAKILFSIAGGLGTPISLDDATSNRSFGHFARVLVDIDLKSHLHNQILVEREDFAFFVYIEFENLPDFCLRCNSIGHLASTCRKNNMEGEGVNPKPVGKKVNNQGKPKDKPIADLVINLEIDHMEDHNLANLERVTDQAPGDIELGLLAQEHIPVDEEVEDVNHKDQEMVLNLQNNEFEVLEDLANSTAAKESRLVGRLSADDSENEAELVETNTYTKVLTKGFGNLGTKLLLKEICSTHKPDVVFISEPMIQVNKIKPLFWSNLSMKFFIANDKAPLPSIWGICKKEVHQIFLNFPGPWCCIGDFNAVLGSNECRGAHLPKKTSSNEFKAFSDSANLTHIVTRGAEFTWSNRRRGSAHTEKRLDRALCNDDWLSEWSSITCCTLPRSNSDHHPLLLCASGTIKVRQPNFKFQKMWLLHHGLRDIIKSNWDTRVVGCPMFVLASKLKNLKVVLKHWNKEVFGNLRVKDALSKVDEIQQCLNLSGEDHDLREQENLAQQELLYALKIEEEFWKEKARINWHSKGDRNTSYFHRLAKIRHSTKAMSMLRKGDTILLDQNEIANHVVSYFTELYASENNVHHNDLINSVVPRVVSADQNCMLTKIPMPEEIKSAVFGMNRDGAPSPDGFGGSFFQDFWDIVGPDFPGADRIEDFRPIALANFHFKVITKVLADRLAIVAPLIVSTQQRGFIKGRHIQDCICIASEAINLLDHKSFGGNLAIKLDIRKAFDTIDWGFISNTLKAFGFDSKFIAWINTILGSAKLSIAVNGQNHGFFSCKRGVRQGDPLSPLLFCLAEDVLSRGLARLHAEGKIHSISGLGNISTPSHVLYADDILIFCKGIKRNILALKKLIDTYAQASGQHINPSKCKFFSTQATPSKIASISSWLGFTRGSLPFSYLGVSIFKGKPKTIHLQPIADRIVLKLAKWKGSTLSIIGRVELVKSIIHSMLVFSFHVYLWPSSLLKLIDKSMRNFIWSGDISTRKLVTVAWHKICTPTIEGGLGLRSISDLNQASLLKLAWGMRSSSQDWALFYRSRFYRASRKHASYVKSSIWPGIKSVWSMINDNTRWVVGSGANINYWLDNWLGNPLATTMNIPLQHYSSLNARVEDFFQDNHWLIPSWMSSMHPASLQSIIKIRVTNQEDKLV